MQTKGTNVSDYVIEELCKDNNKKGLLDESIYFFHNKPLLG